MLTLNKIHCHQRHETEKYNVGYEFIHMKMSKLTFVFYQLLQENFHHLISKMTHELETIFIACKKIRERKGERIPCILFLLQVIKHFVTCYITLQRLLSVFIFILTRKTFFSTFFCYCCCCCCLLSILPETRAQPRAIISLDIRILLVASLQSIENVWYYFHQEKNRESFKISTISDIFQTLNRITLDGIHQKCQVAYLHVHVASQPCYTSNLQKKVSSYNIAPPHSFFSFFYLIHYNFIISALLLHPILFNPEHHH